MKQTLTTIEYDRFMADPAPVWAFNHTTGRMLWANAAALTFWHAESDAEFLQRDYSQDSRAVRERLEQTMNATKKGTWCSESWTLYPKNKPTTVLLDARAYNIEGSADAIVFRISHKLDLADKDPDGLRMLLSARTTSVGASMFDLTGILLSENPASLALRQRYPVWGEHATQLQTRYQSGDVAARIFDAIQTDSIEAFEFTLTGADDDLVLSVTAKRVRDPVTGRPVAHITEEDVTEKVNLARSLSTLNNDLEARVEDRTRELETLNEELRQAQKLEILGKLTGGVAHDFNNMLAVIQGNAELMRLTGSYQDDLVREITDATARGAELTRALLAYARKQPLSAKSVDLRNALNDLKDILRRTLGEGIKLSIFAQPDLWPAFVDDGQIKDVVLNLALNARDAMPNGGTLSIKLSNCSIGQDASSDSLPKILGDFIELKVTDTGSGMVPDVLARATDPFFTTKGVGKGSGMGLSMVYGFARQSSGDMTIQSKPGTGTIIRLYLPRHKNPEKAPAETLARLEIPQGHGEHIVLVEDDDAVRRLMMRVVKSLGYEVTDFRVAQDALDFMRTNPVADLLLTDIILPGGMSGNDLGNLAKGEFPGLKILYMSGYPDGMRLHDDTGGTTDTLLKKPVQYDVLAKSIRSKLDA